MGLVNVYPQGICSNAAVWSEHSVPVRGGTMGAVRGMVRKYAESDKTFDPDAFLRSVEKVLIPEEKDDKMMQEEIRTQAREYAARRGKKERGGDTTQSLTRLK